MNAHLNPDTDTWQGYQGGYDEGWPQKVQKDTWQGCEDACRGVVFIVVAVRCCAADPGWHMMVLGRAPNG